MPSRNQPIHFELFRYQLLPLTQKLQMDMFPDEKFKSINTVEELKKRKNEIFHNIIATSLSLKHHQVELNTRVDMDSPPWFVIDINTQKSLKREKPNFDHEKIDTWPHVTVIINNKPNMQIIAVSRNVRAFNSGKIVAEILQKNLEPVLRIYQLSIQIEALFEKRKFWDLVEKYQGQITSVNFELISPNMANISKTLELDLAKLNTDTNSHRTDLKLNSAKGSTLEINRKNRLVNSLVDYSSAGGGDIVLRMKNIKKEVRTSKSVQKITIENLSVENLSPEQLEKLFETIK